MALYSLAASVDGGSSLTGTTPIFEIRTGERQALLYELQYFNGAAATPGLAFGRSLLPGVGATEVAFTPDDPNDPASTTRLAHGSWIRRPTDPGVYMRRYFYATGNQGGAILWQWRPGLVIPPLTSVVLWNNIATDPSAADISLVIEE